MTTDLLELYGRVSEWTSGKVAGASSHLDVATPCDDWVVHHLMSHMLETQKYFVASAQGRDASPPSPTPTTALSADPVADFKQARTDTVRTFGEPGVIDNTGPSLGFGMIHGRFTDEQRRGVFKPEVTVAPNASAQEKLLAYTGRVS